MKSNWFGTRHDDSAQHPRRSKRQREAERSRSLRGVIASIGVGALLVVGLPTMAFAEATDAPTDPTVTSESTDGTDAAKSSEAPADEVPAEEAPAEETPSEAPAEETPSEPPAEETTPPAEEATPPAEEAPSKAPAKAPAAKSVAPEGNVGITPMAIFPADTADCASSCANLSITNTVVGGTASPNDWTLHAVRSSNSDNYDFESGETRPVPRNNTYTLYADSGPANYTLTNFECSTGGSGSGDPSADEAAHTVTYTNSNGNPTQKYANCEFTHTYTGPATITVQVGGVRTGVANVDGLAGVSLQLYTDNAGTFGSIINQPWAKCTSIASGACTFTVPTPNGARYWVAQSTPGVPSGWFQSNTLATGTTPASSAYRFRTNVIQNGGTYSSLSDFMIATGNTSNNASGGIWQNSLANPPAIQQCGVRVALIIDLSGSVAGSFTQLKNAAKGFVTALQGTPSQIGLFTFNNVAPATAGANLGITPVSTVAGANTVRNHIDTFTTPTNATNWDRGIYQVASSGTQYDLAVVLTDGNPTVYGNDEGPGDRTRFREVENGVFSANALKALKTRVVAFGVGGGVGGAPDNLIAISGGTLNSDYFQSTDYTQAGNILRDLALGSCEGSVSIVKQVVSSSSTGEQKTGQTPAGGWTFTAVPTTGGITPASQSGPTAAGTGALNLPLTFAGGTTTGTVKITEDPQDHTIVQTGGKNAVCTNQATGASITVTNETNGFSLPVSSTQAISCNVWNRPPQPQSTFSVNKVWVINGVTYQNGQQPSGIAAQLTVGGANRDWVTVQGPVPAGTVVSLNETSGVGSRDLCRITDQRVTLANGQQLNAALPYDATLQPGTNSYTMTNIVTCDTQLTLKKSVSNGGVAPTAWTLDAVAPDGALAGPNGTTGSDGATAFVTANVRYPLVETGGDPRYVQTLGLNAVPVPPSIGSWDCVQVNAAGTVIPGFSDGLNGGVTPPLGFRIQCTAVNQTAQLTLVKSVQELDGTDADSAAWTLTATPGGSVPGLVPVSTTTGNTILVRPGTTYTISESGGPLGYEQVDIRCKTSPNGAYTVTNTITLDALAQGTCVVTNKPIAPQIKLTKIVTDSVAPANSWNLTATLGDVVVGGAGGTAGWVDVPAGETVSLAETTSLPNAGEFAPGAWLCSLNGADPTPGPSAAALSPGDQLDCVVTNTLKPFTPNITKTAAIPTSNSDGTWTIGYDIVVTNPSTFQDLTYSLSDQLDFGGDVTVNSASYQLTLPAPPGASTNWTVPFTDEQAFDGEPTLVKGTSHTWHVTVNATVAPGADFGGSNPDTCYGGEPGTVGFLNTATMIVNEVPYEASDCALPVKPNVTKVGGTAVDNGDGTWTLPYTITVTNPSATTGVVYDLKDELKLPASAEQVGLPTVVSKPAGVTTVAAWTGAAPNTLLADDVALAGGAVAHVYQIAVKVRIGADDPAYICPSEAGLNNTATLVSGNQTTDATGCVTVTPPTIIHTKSVVPGSVMQAVDGTWSIAYDIVVTNTGAVGGAYDLADTTHFGAGITGGVYAATKNGAAIPGWTNGSALATGAYLAAGDPDPKDTYRVTVTGIVLTGPDLTPAQTACPSDSASGAFNNTATLTVAGVPVDDSACDAPSAPTIVKAGATSAQQLDGTWNVTYTLTVSNTAPGSKPSFYTLTDAPAFPAGVEYLSYAIDGGAAVTPYDGSEFTVVEDQPIAAGEVDVYTVVLNVDAPASEIDPAELECKSDNNPDGVGFLNDAILTSGQIVREDDDCTDISRGGNPTVLKTDPTVTQDGDGLWTLVYDITVTGNSEFISRYTLDDTLRFGPEVDVLSASWTGETSGAWADPASDPTAHLVPTNKVIERDDVHTYTVTVTANVDKAAFADPTTNTCQPAEGTPDVGFLNEAVLTPFGGTPTSSTGCGLPAMPEITKTFNGPVTGDASGWTASYTITVHNTSTDQALVYDLDDTVDFADGVNITGATVASTGDPVIAVNPAWDGSAVTEIVENEDLDPAETHTFTVTVTFTVDSDAPTEGLICAGDDGEGHGLLNGATVTSGDTYDAEDCGDVPVTVEVTKLWVINGGDPIAWDSDELPDGFEATLQLDGASSEWDTAYGPYAAGDSVTISETDVTTPEGVRCSLDQEATTGLGDEVLEGAVNEFTVTNYVDCTQTVNLAKVVENPNGGDGEAADWTLSGTGVSDEDDTFSGKGTATGSVALGQAYTLNEVSTVWENGVEYTVSSTWTCSTESGDADDVFSLVSTPGATSATLTVLQYGASVDCEITNTDVAPTLTLTKHVEPESVAGDFPPSLWHLTASDDGTAVVEGDGTATGDVKSNTPYDLAESADFPEAGEFDPSDWTCTVTNTDPATPAMLDDDAVSLQPGQEVECEITNTAKPATYELHKTVTSTEQQPDGTWAIEYSVTVENTSGVSPLEYDLSDDLSEFGEGIVIESADWSGDNGLSGSWEDLPDTLETDFATGQLLAAGETDTYTVTVVATVTAEAWTSESGTECTAGEGYGQGGFRNVAELTVGGLPTEETACDGPGTSTAVKTVSDGPTDNGDGTFDVAYEITVTNASDKDQYYDLSDTPAFPAGTTFTAAATDPDGNVVEDWTGIAPDGTVLADARLIPAAGEEPTVEVWTITATVKVDTITDIDDAKCLENETGHGFYNAGEYTSGTITTPISDCVDIPIAKLTLVKHVDNSALGDITGGVASDWTLFADSEDNSVAVAGSEEGVSQIVSIGEYYLYEDSIEDPSSPLVPDYYEASAWQCGEGESSWSVSVEAGDDVTCEITNTAFLVDVGIEKTAELPEGVTAVDDTEDNTFNWVLTVTNHGKDVEDLEVTDLIDPSLEITGPATFEAPENWTESTEGNQFTAAYTGTFVEGQVTTITIPVRVLPAEVEAPAAVGPDDPAPVLPEFPANQVIPNTACVSTSGYVAQRPERVAALALEVPEGNLGDINPDNDCADAEVPVKKVDAGVYVRCIADVPWLYYNVQATENVEPGDITVTWTSADGTQTKVQTIPWDAREGRLLWPGAAVDEDGLPYQFPGWRPITEEDLTNPPTPGTRFLDLILDDSLPSYAWRDMDNPASVVFSVNPSQTVLAVYPQALPTCAIDRPGELDIEKTASVTSTKANGDFSYSLQVTSVGTGATEPTEVFDEIPATLRVDEITTAPAPAFPRWENCEVTGKDSSGYGGTLHCDLLGQLGPNFTSAPVIDLAVHVKPGATVSTIDNTGEVCWQTADDPDPVTECADDTVTVTLLGGTAITGFATGPWIWGAAGLLFLGGLAVVWVVVRRRREASAE
ncbi:cytoskeletal protein RodZ [Agromyces terreus]|uniref:Cytoskeletal protein RodZ n=1 Tax=Agromyces terreus TaxID=424795 RepID=A0A9X2KCC5_9MICO|nr:VWA domain-containing protein [Agromyces terreus]MCP2371246.1 cytoskeletal protein RodZ [Agromyces terreus]